MKRASQKVLQTTVSLPASGDSFYIPFCTLSWKTCRITITTKHAERYLVNSGQNYTILQPSRYMQHLVPIWNTVLETGIHAMPFSAKMKFSVADLHDLAEATAAVAIEEGHDNATYQLAGPEQLSQTDMAEILSNLTGKDITAQAKSLEQFEADARSGGMPEARLQTMLKMNTHYDSPAWLATPMYFGGFLDENQRTSESS